MGAYKKGSIRMCPDMTSSCCTKASMATYYSSIRGGSMKRMSAIFWSVSRSLSASVQLYGGLSSKLVAAAAKIPKRRLQKGRSSVRKSSSRKVKAVKVKRSAPKARASLKIKSTKRASAGIRVRSTKRASAGIRIRSTTRARKTIKIRVNKTRMTASSFLVGTVARARFVKGWTHLVGLAQNRRSIQISAKNCFRSLAALKTQMGCLACDNTQSEFTKNGVQLKTAELKSVTQNCAKFVYWLPQIKQVVVNAADMILSMKANTEIQTLRDATVAAMMPSMSGCYASPATTEVAWTAANDKRGKCSMVKKAGVKLSINVKKPSASMKLKMGAAISAGTKKIGASIKAGAKKMGASIKAGAVKIGNATKKAAVKVSLGAKKAVASVKSGLKIKVPKVKLSVKANAGLRMLQMMVKKPVAKAKVTIKKPTAKITIRKPTAKVTVKKPVATGPVMVDFKAAKSLKCGKNNKMVVVQIKDDTKCFQSRTFAKMINGASQGAPGVTGRPMKTLITLLTPTMKLLDAIMRQGNAGTQRMWVRFTGKKWAFPTTMKKIIKKVKVGAAKLGLKIKASSSKVKAGANKVGLKIKLGANKAVAATKKFGASLSAGFKKVGASMKAGVKKVGASMKAGVKKSVAATKKVGAKIGASIKVGLPKVKVTAPKASLKLSVRKKSRRMQAAAAKPAAK